MSLIEVGKKKFPLLAAIAIISTAIIGTLPSLFIPLGLPPEGDAVDYRIPIIKWMLRNGSYPNWPWSVVDDYPMLGELLMLPMHWVSPSFVRLISIFAYIGAAFFAAKIVEIFRKQGPVQSLEKSSALFWLSFAWFLSFRTLLIQSNLIMVDNLAACFVVGSVYFILLDRFRMAGLFCGLALASRYSAIPMIFPICLWMGIRFLQYRNWKELLSFSALVLLPFLPFALRNYILNGNPFFPLFSKEANLWVANPLPTDLISFFKLPFYLFFFNEFKNNIFDYTLGKVFFIHFGSALVALGILVKKRSFLFSNWNRQWSFVAFFLISSTATWYFSAQHLRLFIHTLLLSYAVLFFWAEKCFSPKIIGTLALIGIFSIASVQKDSVLMALGKRDSIFEYGRKKAEECYIPQLKAGDVVGHTSRDGVLGFFDYNFEYMFPHPYALRGKNTVLPQWVFGFPEEKSLYEPWPSEKPCAQKLRSAP
jgi:hypothetical protein